MPQHHHSLLRIEDGAVHTPDLGLLHFLCGREGLLLLIHPVLLRLGEVQATHAPLARFCGPSMVIDEFRGEVGVVAKTRRGALLTLEISFEAPLSVLETPCGVESS